LFFVCQIGFKILLSASDVVYAVTALLEATYFSPEATENAKGDTKNPYDDGQEVRDDIWIKNFYKAFDALDEYAPLFCSPSLPGMTSLLFLAVLIS